LCRLLCLLRALLSLHLILLDRFLLLLFIFHLRLGQLVLVLKLIWLLVPFAFVLLSFIVHVTVTVKVFFKTRLFLTFGELVLLRQLCDYTKRLLFVCLSDFRDFGLCTLVDLVQRKTLILRLLLRLGGFCLKFLRYHSIVFGNRFEDLVEEIKCIVEVC
jgi:hypothetical protein